MTLFKGKDYKAIICDFDGTLVGRNLIISDPVKQAIRLLKSKDVKFVIASGRSFNGLIKNASRELNLLAPQIVRGGSEIVDPSTACRIFFRSKHGVLPFLI